MKQLGLDLSTVTSGWAVSEDTKLLNCGFFDISKVKTYKEKAKIIINGLENIEFDNICIEEAVNRFALGNSSADTIIKLIKNKVVISYILEEHYKKEIISAGALTMRKNVFGKAFIKGVKSKEYVKQKIESMFDVSKYIIKTSRGNVDVRMGDVYDAIVASLFSPQK